jgi:putative NADPH-quinone reductase
LLLETELILYEIKKNLQWSNHFVCIYPTWWITFPAKLKGLFDRAILPGFGFHYHKTDSLWDRLLKGKSARLIATMDGPGFIYTLLGSPGMRAIKYGVLEFCGIHPVRTTIYTKLKSRSEKRKNKWIEKIKKLGTKGQ